MKKLCEIFGTGVPKYFIQWIATLGVFTLHLQAGIHVGWNSPNIPHLTGPNSTIPMTNEEASWLASIPNIGLFIGSVLGSIINYNIGSKKTVLLTFVITAVSWLILIITNDIIWLYSSRFIAGIAAGTTNTCFPLYLGEISSPKIRGSIFSIAVIGIPVGVLIGSIAETYLPMAISSSIYLGQCLTSILLFWWLMDSPYHLARENNHEIVKKSIVFYNSDCDVDKELIDIIEFVQTNTTSIKDKLQDFATPAVKKSLVLIIILFILPPIIGAVTIVSYAETILSKGKLTVVEPKEFVIYTHLITIISSTLTHNLIDKLGRRILLIIASIGSAIGMTGLGLHFFLLDVGYNSKNIEWLITLSIITALISYLTAFTSVPNTVLSEIFTENMKNIAACISALINALFTFSMVKIYQTMVDSIGESYTFWVHAGLSLTPIPIALFLLPETKGKKFQDIQNDLTRKKDVKV